MTMAASHVHHAQPVLNCGITAAISHDPYVLTQHVEGQQSQSPG